MLGRMLAVQLSRPDENIRLRSWCVGAALLLGLGWLLTNTASVEASVRWLSWGLFLLGLLVGGAMTGWRVTQFPKSRAAEFYLVAPLTDWELILGEALGGMLKTGLVVLTSLPLAGLLVGLGWITPPQAAAMIGLPIVFGWFVGLGLATVAYAPLRLRRVFEWITLIGVLSYLVLFGPAGLYFLPWAWRTYLEWSTTTAGAWVAYLNPFQLLGDIAGKPLAVDGLRVAAVLGALGLLVALGLWWLRVRLRWHYLEENYGNQYRKKEYVKPIGSNPLTWWTHRRVSRFRGKVNIYLGWGTIAMYSAYLLLGDAWPDRMGTHLLLMFTFFGGAAMLGCFGLQFGLVSTAFLSGLWDSNSQQRLGRMELLLVSPLTPWEFLTGSLMASWTRGKQYLAMALVVWMAACWAGQISPVALVAAVFCSAAYITLYFALAFRNFAKLTSDQAAGSWGLAMSVGIPMGTWLLFQLKLPLLGALTPLGGVFLLTSSPNSALVASTGVSWPVLWGLILTSATLYAAAGVWITRQTLATFEHDIRVWFAANLISPEARKKAKAAPVPQPKAEPQVALAESS